MAKSTSSTTDAHAETVAEQLAPFRVEGDSRDTWNTAVYRTPSDAARALADLAARLAALPADAVPAGWPFSIMINIQPWGKRQEDHEEQVTAFVDHEEQVTAFVDAVASALGVEAVRNLNLDGSVHYMARAATPGGARVDAFAAVPANEQERTDHRRRQAGHEITIRELGTVAGNGHALVKATCSCRDWEVELPRGRALHFWGKHADKAIAALLGGVS